MDYIPLDTTINALRKIFENEGRVNDIFISRKARKFRREAFSFVRYYNLQDAKNAVRNLDGFEVKGMRLSVSMAKYNKGGVSFKKLNSPSEEKAAGFRRITKPFFRDQRKYAEVLMGKQKVVSKGDEGKKAIPINFTIEAVENKEIVKMLDQAIIAENTDVINIIKAEKEVVAFSKYVKGM